MAYGDRCSCDAVKGSVLNSHATFSFHWREVASFSRDMRRRDEARSERSARASEECSPWPNISINLDGELTHSEWLRALNCRLCHRNALCLKAAFLLYRLVFPSPRFHLPIKLPAVHGLPLWLDSAFVSLRQGVSERCMFDIRKVCSRFVLMRHRIHAIVLLFSLLQKQS